MEHPFPILRGTHQQTQFLLLLSPTASKKKDLACFPLIFSNKTVKNFSNFSSVKTLLPFIPVPHQQHPHSAYLHLCNINRFNPPLPRSHAAAIRGHGLVPSPLDHCKSRLFNLTQSFLHKLPNFVARVITRILSVHHIMSVPPQLHCLPVQFHNDLKILLYRLRSIHSLTPLYMSDLLHITTPSHSLGYFSIQLTCLPPHHEFSCSAPRLWKSPEIRNISSPSGSMTLFSTEKTLDF